MQNVIRFQADHMQCRFFHLPTSDIVKYLHTFVILSIHTVQSLYYTEGPHSWEIWIPSLHQTEKRHLQQYFQEQVWKICVSHKLYNVSRSSTIYDTWGMQVPYPHTASSKSNKFSHFHLNHLLQYLPFIWNVVKHNHEVLLALTFCKSDSGSCLLPGVIQLFNLLWLWASKLDRTASSRKLYFIKSLAHMFKENNFF